MGPGTCVRHHGKRTTLASRDPGCVGIGTVGFEGSDSEEMQFPTKRRSKRVGFHRADGDRLPKESWKAWKNYGPEDFKKEDEGKGLFLFMEDEVTENASEWPSRRCPGTWPFRPTNGRASQADANPTVSEQVPCSFSSKQTWCFKQNLEHVSLFVLETSFTGNLEILQSTIVESIGVGNGDSSNN